MPKPSDDLPQADSTWILIDDFEYLCFQLAKEKLEFDEPIPEYDTRNNELLESALGLPRQTFNGRLLYPTLIKQAAILFYAMIKNHPFRNGNKRIAVMTLIVFLAINRKWLSVKPSVMYLIATDVSSSKSEKKDEILWALDEFIGKGIKDVKELNS